jgi:hypothetical protein
VKLSFAMTRVCDGSPQAQGDVTIGTEPHRYPWGLRMRQMSANWAKKNL